MCRCLKSLEQKSPAAAHGTENRKLLLFIPPALTCFTYETNSQTKTSVKAWRNQYETKWIRPQAADCRRRWQHLVASLVLSLAVQSGLCRHVQTGLDWYHFLFFVKICCTCYSRTNFTSVSPNRHCQKSLTQKVDSGQFSDALVREIICVMFLIMGNHTTDFS